MEKQTIYSMFKHQVNKVKNQNAIVFKNNKSLFYFELYKIIEDISAKLKESNIKKGSIIAFKLARDPKMIAAIFSIFSLDCAYLPIDLELPDDRVSYMLDNSGVRFLITEQNTIINKDIELETILPYNLKLIKLKGKESQVKNYSNLAYVIYTSGSTGLPKGVMVKESGVINFIHAMQEIIEFDKCKNILASTTSAFDISFLELILPLTLGLSVILADEIQQKDPNLLLNLIAENNVDLIQFTPSRLLTLITDKSHYDKLQSLKYILVGGEKFPETLLKKLKAVNSEAKILNMYGPTETTIWSTYEDLTNENHVSIGKPIKNTKIYVVDNSGNIIKEDKNSGEICIAGDGLACGYINKKQLTDEKFIFLKEANEYVYKTGDLGFWNKNNLECIGRMDFQIKINGYRIELEEIESLLNNYPNIQRAVVVISKTKSNVFLKAYIKSNKKIDIKDIKEYLKSKLPSYMVPSIIEEINEIPLMINGKVDRNKLKHHCEKTTSVDEVKFENETQKQVSEIWSKVLGIKAFDVNKNFFDYGGTSLSIAMVESLINEKFKIDISVLDLFEHTTIAQISKFINNKNRSISSKKEPFYLNIKKLKK